MSGKVLCLSFALLSALNVAALAQSGPAAPTNGSQSTRKESGQAGKVNLNTATADELRKLPRLSPGSANAIIESRKKSNFKDWNDFVSRRLVPSFTEKEIKGLVAF